jgi:molybdopterin/thiamine biosynthesis adenylyltransferase/molybdopterin synthase catalytic subunit/rhodanese-related sulfurtransferase
MFKISPEPIAIPELNHDGAGGFVSFEGKVRNANEGKEVLRLEYDAFIPLAEAEGQRILDEATDRFGLLSAAAIHRIGTLEIGDSAVWIGVAAKHRTPAFEACAYVIDQLKRRVPIWKKEHYSSGASEWLGVHDTSQESTSGHHLYGRQIALPEVGESGQAKLRQARILVVGAGGLGSACLPLLAGAGIGEIHVCDADAVEASNLHRQTLYSFADVGKSKARTASERLKGLNPKITIHAHEALVDHSNARQLVSGMDLVVDGTDNFAAKLALNAACVEGGVPFVTASVHRFHGQLMTVAPGSASGCLRCLAIEPPYDGCVGTCRDEGVLGPAVAVLGSWQAMAALANLLELPEETSRHLLAIDFLSLQITRLKRLADPNCPVCGTGMEGETIDVSREEAKGWMGPIIDVRTEEEWAIPLQIVPSLRIPSTNLEELARAIGTDRALLVCATGRRSAASARALRRRGVEAYSLLGGCLAKDSE